MVTGFARLAGFCREEILVFTIIETFAAKASVAPGGVLPLLGASLRARPSVAPGFY
jgi:hypothetical protein